MRLSEKFLNEAFMDPFVGRSPETALNDRELARAIRLAITSEHEAIHLYESLADALPEDEDYNLLAQVFQDIANEEKVHIGELNEILKVVDPNDEEYLEDGEEEVEEMKEEQE